MDEHYFYLNQIQKKFYKKFIRLNDHYNFNFILKAKYCLILDYIHIKSHFYFILKYNCLALYPQYND